MGLESISSLFLLALLLLPPYTRGQWSTFTVPHSTNASADDTPALMNALASGKFNTNATILFEKGVHYNIFTPIKFPVLNNVEVRIEGNLSYPVDIGGIQSKRCLALCSFLLWC